MDKERAKLKYIWQRIVYDAVITTDDKLPKRIQAAEIAIAQRQADLPEPDFTERIAIDDALRLLRILIVEARQYPERVPVNENRKRA
jgi:hypothetical protein